jgi:uncharacterized protein YhhL (DUF1145 family)
MNAPKIGLLVVWLLCAAGFVVATDSMFATAGRFVFWLMLAAHVLEFVLFSARLRQAPGSLPAHFFNTLVFGVLHIRDLPAVDDEKEGRA